MTFNYLLTHRVIPQLMYSHLDLFYESILVNPQVMQRFMQKSVAHATVLAEKYPDVETWTAPVFEMGLYGKSQERSVIAVEIPYYGEDCDCVSVAFPTLREKAAYFTGELGLNVADNTPCFFLGGWKPNGNGFTHVNYGQMEPENMERFVNMVLDIVYES